MANLFTGLGEGLKGGAQATAFFLTGDPQAYGLLNETSLGSSAGIPAKGLYDQLSGKAARRAEESRKRALRNSQIQAQQERNKTVREAFQRRRRAQGAQYGAISLQDGGNTTTSLLIRD